MDLSKTVKGIGSRARQNQIYFNHYPLLYYINENENNYNKSNNYKNNENYNKNTIIIKCPVQEKKLINHCIKGNKANKKDNIFTIVNGTD